MNRIIFLVMFSSFIYSQCDEYSQNECVGDNSCDWIEDVEFGNCSDYSTGTECETDGNCNWECTQWGSWYTWICYGTYVCMGGTFEDDNSYCDEIEFLIGDTNLDHTINIQDVLVLINLILSNESGYNTDVNDDGIINVLDVIELVYIILNN